MASANMPAKGGQIEVMRLPRIGTQSNADSSGKRNKWAEPARRASLRRRTTTNRRSRSPFRSRTTTTRMATSPRRSATARQRRRAVVERITFVKRSAAQQSGTLDEWPAKMRFTHAFTSLAEPSLSIIRILPRSSRCAPKPPRANLIADFGEASKIRRHPQRHRADPVQPHRREFLACCRRRVRSVANSRQHSLIMSRRVPPRDAHPSSACIARCVRTPARLSGTAAGVSPSDTRSNSPTRSRPAR